MKAPVHKLTLACVAAGSLASLHAANVDQTANSSAGWNDAAYWGGTAATSGNDYFSTSFQGTGSVVTSFVTNGTSWTFTSGGTAYGTVRDSPNPGANSTFAGDSLTLRTNTRLLGKVRNGSTSTVDLVFGGGFYMSGVDNGNGSAILDGTISFASGINLGAIGVNPNTAGDNAAMRLTVSSEVIGDLSDTLQLTLFTENAAPGTGTRLGELIFNGDITGFGGTLYVGTSVSGTNANSFYSVQSSSLSTTLHLDYAAGNNFRYDLAGFDTTFGAVQLGASLLAPGTYDAAALNGLVGGGTRFFGAGSITVVPEPSTYATAVFGLLVVTAVLRRKRSKA